MSLLKMLIGTSAILIPIADVAAATQSFLPSEDIAQFLVQNLDLSTFRNSLGPRRSESQRTFSALGVKPTKVQADAVVLENSDWFYSLRILQRGDINRDGLEDLVVCFTDRAKHGTYSAQQPLLVTRYSSSSYAVALKFEVTGCAAYAK